MMMMIMMMMLNVFYNKHNTDKDDSQAFNFTKTN